MKRGPQKPINLELHPRRDLERRYILRNEGRCRMKQINQSVEEEKRSLAQYVESSQAGNLKEVRKEAIIKCVETNNDWNVQTVKNSGEMW